MLFSFSFADYVMITSSDTEMYNICIRPRFDLYLKLRLFLSLVRARMPPQGKGQRFTMWYGIHINLYIIYIVSIYNIAFNRFSIFEGDFTTK